MKWNGLNKRYMYKIYMYILVHIWAFLDESIKLYQFVILNLFELFCGFSFLFPEINHVFFKYIQYIKIYYPKA